VILCFNILKNHKNKMKVLLYFYARQTYIKLLSILWMFLVNDIIKLFEIYYSVKSKYHLVNLRISVYQIISFCFYQNTYCLKINLYSFVNTILFYSIILLLVSIYYVVYIKKCYSWLKKCNTGNQCVSFNIRH